MSKIVDQNPPKNANKYDIIYQDILIYEIYINIYFTVIEVILYYVI